MNAELLEAINALVAASFIAAGFIVLRYVYGEIRANGYKRLRVQAAVSLGAIFCGEAVKAAVIWWVRSSTNDGLPPDFIVLHQDQIIFVGAVILAVGVLCYIRIWAPRKWGEWPWLGTAVVSGTFALMGLIPALVVWLFLGIVFWFSRWKRPTP